MGDYKAATEYSKYVQDLTAEIDVALRSVGTEAYPESLYEPVRYVLRGGGKRLRPVLLILTAEAYGSSRSEAVPAALAIEIFHNFTLVHDDIMDHAAERRGRPTVHEKWDNNVAILAGDLLLGYAYTHLARVRRGNMGRLLDCFNTMVVQLCEGQALDKEFETTYDVTVPDYLEMISRKTGALLQAVFELGGIIGGAPEQEIRVLREAGREIGMAFQVQDDLLDLTAESAAWGKQVGGDLIEGKKTFILLRAIERSGGREREWLQDIFRRNGLDPQQVQEGIRHIDQSGAMQEARDFMTAHYETALIHLQRLPENRASAAIRWIVRRMQDRSD